MLAVVALVALRLALGCHFLYEGVWKITHREEFTAAPFLTQAKGPVSLLFYAMIPDIDARQRLAVVADAKGNKKISSDAVAARWQSISQDYTNFYFAEPFDVAAKQKFVDGSDATLKKFQKQLDEYLQDNVGDIAAYFGSLDRFEKDAERFQDAPFQKQRHWERMMDLRREADKWVKDIDGQEKAFKNSLYSLLGDEQKQRGAPSIWNPLRWSQMDFVNFAVTYGLTAIGICLMLGFFTPLAALGGAAFMCFVVMTQPAFPTIFPHDPPVVGHALLINKDFVEMVALLVISATAAGRWGGLDFFIARWVVTPFLARRNKTKVN